MVDQALSGRWEGRGGRGGVVILSLGTNSNPLVSYTVRRLFSIENFGVGTKVNFDISEMRNTS